MKRWVTMYLSIPFLLLVTGCSKEPVLPDLPNTRIDTTVAMLKVNGDFVNGPYGTVSGQARIYRSGDSLLVALQHFSSSGGPDLKVYLSLEQDPVHFVNLGSLKSTNGNQVYYCPAGTVISQYKYVLIYCQQYKHLFGSAQL